MHNLQLLSDVADSLHTKCQLVSFGLKILRNVNNFQDGIKAWNCLPAANQTWQAFIAHFDNEHEELLKLRGPTMQSSNLYQANALAATVKDAVETVVTASLKRHSANATFSNNDKNGSITGNSNLPPELQNLPPSCTIEEITPDHAANATKTV